MIVWLRLCLPEDERAAPSLWRCKSLSWWSQRMRCQRCTRSLLSWKAMLDLFLSYLCLSMAGSCERQVSAQVTCHVVASWSFHNRHLLDGQFQPKVATYILRRLRRYEAARGDRRLARALSGCSFSRRRALGAEHATLDSCSIMHMYVTSSLTPAGRFVLQIWTTSIRIRHAKVLPLIVTRHNVRR
jgi:hypothetical protein